MRRNFAAGMALLCTVLAPAQPLELAAVFADGAVLQQAMPVPVWGRASAGDQISVSFAGQTRAGQADNAGRWTVTLAPMPASSEPRSLLVGATGDQTVSIGSVLVGEVWLCSGQSNMQFPLKSCRHAATEIATASFPALRMFTVKQVVAGTPQADVTGSWAVCSPDSAGEFSAVAYLFGRAIHRTQQVPVGLIHASCGWTPSEAWTPRAALLADPETAYIAARWDHVADPDVQAAYAVVLKVWDEQAKLLKEKGKEPPPKPKSPGDPNFIHRAAGLWNGMIAPLTSYAQRGVIWYQGETNERRGYRYRFEFPLLIESWRRAMQRPSLPFLFVQVASVLPPDRVPVESEWAELRESQALALELPHTGMAVTIDIGEADDVHPKNKQDVGHRLALIARAQVYGEDIPYRSPSYESMQLEGDHIRVTFANTYGGLKTADGGPVAGFAIAGADRRYYYARAEIAGDAVTVSSDQVAAPVAVRYAWANNPAGCNLYNAADLPACPFRTDDWPAKTGTSKGLVIDDF